MGDNSKKPEIRFKGFTDDWEQRKLDDWGTFYYGKRCPKWSVTEDSTTPCIRYGELYTKFGAKIDRVYSYTNMSPENLRFSKGTEVLIPRVGEDPMDYNHWTWLSMPNVAIGEMISVFNTDNNPLFTAMMFNATLQNEFAMRVEGGSVTNLYFEKLKSIEVSFPSIPEQEKIAAYFDSIDHLITLHQRKYDKLVMSKKSMLEKMFPKNGQTKPEIRFSGFTDDWEQRKFSDITFPAGEKNKDNLPLESYSITNEHGFVPQDEKFENGGTMREADKRMYYIVSPNSFAYNPARINVGSIGYQNVGKNVIVSSLYEVFKTSEVVDDRLLWHWFKSPDFQKLIMQLQEGGVRLYFYYDKLCMGEVSLPSLEEQRKVGKLFDTLNNLITLHQRKVFSRLFLDKSTIFREN